MDINLHWSLIGSSSLVLALNQNTKRSVFTTELYILWSELSRRKLSPTLATAHYSCPDNAIELVAQCELSLYVKSG